MSATDAQDAGAGDSTHQQAAQMSDNTASSSGKQPLDSTSLPDGVTKDGGAVANTSAVREDLISTQNDPFAGGAGTEAQELSGPEKQDAEAREAIQTPAPDGVNLATAGTQSGSDSVEDAASKPTREPLSLSIRDKPRISSPPPPAPPPKDAELQSVAAGKQPEYQEYDEKRPPEDDSVVDQHQSDNESRSEIQSIMDQFGEEGKGLGKEEILSPRMEIASPVFFPPRGSSLEPDSQGSPTSSSLRRPASRDSYNFNASKARPPSITEGLPPPPPPASEKPDALPPQSPGGNSVFQPPPPSPDPEPALPFDFHRFLEQLRHRTADPVARFLRSFLNEFGKKQWQVHEQVKIISDFLEFISKKMSQCDVWRTVSDAEFDNAREGMEKLVMNRLYSQTFSPAIPPVESISSTRTRRARANAASTSGPGRRGQHQEDVERDDVIAQKIRIYGWIKEEHLDIPSVGDKGRKFLSLAQQELLKINSYRAPRDKVIQILNCCKVIFGFLKNNKTDQSADSFVPLLIYTVLKANPTHLVSNVQYILRFRNQDKLGGEAGYYISSLMGVISFVENLDRTNLTISNEDFEANVEAAVSAIAEGHKAEEYESRTSLDPNTIPSLTPPSSTTTPGPDTSPLLPHLSEKSAPSRPEVTPRNSMDAERASPRRTSSRRLGSSQDTSSSSAADDLASGLLRTIQKPLSGIGRMFSDEAPPPQPPRPGGQRSPTRPGFPGVQSQQGQGAREDSEVLRMFGGSRTRSQRGEMGRRSQEGSGQLLGVPAGPGGREHEEAIRQASVAEAEATRIRSEEHRVVVETLQGMFPDLDKDVISDVVRMKQGRVGMAVDACLALSAS
ncbi:hypothetical protein KVT40_006435 [Elsinoe batatas]|uniref:Vacuolar protein sorting-associated protein 9a n=1 Tax=Elsinoe batatas TaxID=2601811 RepID=A0A8K0L080_9PEZI|nr:hypothetical protein KVT40_006435 [Elsinoe batatas]